MKKMNYLYMFPQLTILWYMLNDGIHNDRLYKLFFGAERKMANHTPHPDIRRRNKLLGVIKSPCYDPTTHLAPFTNLV